MDSQPILIANARINAVLVLADGAFFFGQGIGAKGTIAGEICFNTSLTGYQEILTDPSYANQIITFTFPHIGNVGCNEEDKEASHVYCNGLVIREPITSPSNFRSENSLQEWLESKNLTGICGVDTRALTRHIRDKGACVAAVYFAEEGAELNVEKILNDIKDMPTLKDTELASEVTRKVQASWNEKSFTLGQSAYAKNESEDYHVVAFDYGAKDNILRCLSDKKVKVTVLPAKSPIDDVIALQPDGVFLSNGPADPHATASYTVPVIKAILEQGIPTFGICMGHQLLSIASGLQTEKMHQGHRGANHPVKNLLKNTVEITSQNHGFCVSDNKIPDNVEVTHRSLFDNTIEGIRRTDVPAFSVQYHPESSPGPHDSHYLFDEFLEMIIAHKNLKEEGSTAYA